MLTLLNLNIQLPKKNNISKLYSGMIGIYSFQKQEKERQTLRFGNWLLKLKKRCRLLQNN